MEEVLQMTQVVMLFLLFISILGVIINGFKVMSVGESTAGMQEACSNLVGHGMGTIFASFITITLEVLIQEEGMSSSISMSHVSTLLCWLIVGTFALGILYIVNAFISTQQSNDVLSVVVEKEEVKEEILLDEYIEETPQQNVHELEKLLSMIEKRY